MIINSNSKFNKEKFVLYSIQSVTITKDVYKKLLDDSVKLVQANKVGKRLKESIEAKNNEIRRLKYYINQLESKPKPKLVDAEDVSIEYPRFFVCCSLLTKDKIYKPTKLTGNFEKKPSTKLLLYISFY